MSKLKNILGKKPLFVFLLILFFTLHNFFENYHYSLGLTAFKLSLIYTAVATLLILLCWLLFKDFYKSAFYTFWLMAFNFFFGSFHDFLKTNFEGSFITKYSFIIPVVLLLFIVLAIFLKRTKKSLTYFGSYLSILFLLFIIINIITYLPGIIKKSSSTYSTANQLKLNNCDTCSRPDIYLILADEYAGKTQLENVFSFNNAEFENQLNQRGFHITNNSKANYNSTAYSMASMFNMMPISGITQNKVNHKDMLICIELIKKNNLVSYLNSMGYQIVNNSPFDIGSKKKLYTNPFFVSNEEIFIGQTFLHRFRRDIGYHFISNAQVKNTKDLHKNNNIKAEVALVETIETKKKLPKFVYTHFLLPHHPYYFDSAGNDKKYNPVTDSYPNETKDYIQYLIYTNKKLLSLIDQIKKGASSPPIIILMSDHGYRQVADKNENRYHFSTINAVFLPGGNYSQFYEGMSNINQFRVILNTQFNQKLPLMKDSLTFLELE